MRQSGQTGPGAVEISRNLECRRAVPRPDPDDWRDMPDVKVDTELLREAGGQLMNIVDAFSYAKHDAAELAEYVGHSGLAKRVRNFADNWQSRRQDMLEVIGNLGEVADGVGLGFEQWDTELANAITPDPEVQAAMNEGQVPQ